MGHILALEGAHNAGKTTLARQVKEIADDSGHWSFVSNIHHSRGDSTPDKLDADRRMVEDAPSDHLFIFDRTYLSELAHAPVNGRASTIPFDPLYWEQYMGAWMDRRGLRLYLMDGPLHSDKAPATQMYEALVSGTAWAQVFPRKHQGLKLARDIQAALMGIRHRNETMGIPPDCTPVNSIANHDKNHLSPAIEEIAGMERTLFELRFQEDLPNRGEIAASQYRRLAEKRRRLDSNLLRPFGLSQ